MLILVSPITGCVSKSTFASLVGIPISITSSAVGLKFCVITSGIKKCKSIIKRKRRKHDKVVLLAKTKLNTREVLSPNALIESTICHDEFFLMNDVLKELNDMKKGLKNPGNS